LILDLSKAVSRKRCKIVGIIFGCTNIHHFDRTFVQTLIAPCIADRSGTKVLCANFFAIKIQSYSVHKGSICSDSTIMFGCTNI